MYHVQKEAFFRYFDSVLCVFSPFQFGYAALNVAINIFMRLVVPQCNVGFGFGFSDIQH